MPVMPCPPVPFILAATSTLLLVTAAASAGVETDVVWEGLGDGESWSDALNWTPNAVPVNDDVTTFNVTIDTTGTIFFDLDDPTEITDLTLGLGQTLSLNRGHTLTVLDDAFINGIITVQNSSFLAEAAGASFGIASNAKLDASGGGLIAIAGTYYEGNRTSDIMVATGSATIDVSSLQEIVINNASGGSNHTFRAESNGHIDLSGLLTLTSTSGDDLVRFVMNSGGTIDLSGLTETIASGGEIQFILDSTTSELPSLEVADDVGFYMPVDSTLDLPVLITFHSSSITLDANSTINAPSLIDVTNSTIVLEQNQILNSAPLLEIDNAAFLLAAGASVDIAAASWAGNRNGDFLRASGPTTVLDLTSLETLTVNNASGGGSHTIRAESEGTVDLSGVVTITNTSGDDVINLVTESNGLIDLSSLTEIDSAGGPVRLITSADATLPSLTVAEQLELTSQNGAVITLPLLTSLIGGEIEDLGAGGTVDAPQLNSVPGTLIILDDDDILITDTLTEVDGASFRLSGGASVDVAASSYITGATGLRFFAEGPTTTLDLSSLETITLINASGGAVHDVARASAGGTVDLSGAVTITNTSTDDRNDYEVDSGGQLDLGGLSTVTSSGGIVRFTATGAGSALDLSSFATFTSPVQCFLTSACSARFNGIGVTGGNGQFVANDDVSGFPAAEIDGAVRNEITDEARFKTDDLKLTMTSDYATFEAASEDLGAVPPTPGTFEFGELTFVPAVPEAVFPGDDLPPLVVFVNNFGNGNSPDPETPESVYVTGHDGFDGIPALNGGTLLLNGLNVYTVDGGAWINLQDVDGGVPPVGAVPYKDGFVANRLAETVGDFDGSTCIDASDLAALLSNWGGSNPVYDLNGDGTIGAADLAALLANWGCL